MKLNPPRHIKGDLRNRSRAAADRIAWVKTAREAGYSAAQVADALGVKIGVAFRVSRQAGHKRFESFDPDSLRRKGILYGLTRPTLEELRRDEMADLVAGAAKSGKKLIEVMRDEWRAYREAQR